MPSAGGFSQTAINQRAGARTQLSELVTVVLAVGCALFLADVLSDLPEATLGCLVMVAVLGLIKPAEFVRFWQLSRVEFWVAMATAVSGLALGLLAAVADRRASSPSCIVIVELDRIQVTELQPAARPRRPRGRRARPPSRCLACWSCASTGRSTPPTSAPRTAASSPRSTPPSHGRELVVVDATAVAVLTVTVIDEFQQIEHELLTRDVELWIAALPPRSLATARKTPRWAEMEAAGRVHPTALAAVRRFRAVDTDPAERAEGGDSGRGSAAGVVGRHRHPAAPSPTSSPRSRTEGGTGFVPPPERVAVFDNDGTLWTEKPIPIQLDFTLLPAGRAGHRRPVPRRAASPTRRRSPTTTTGSGAAMVKHYHGDDADMALLLGAVSDGVRRDDGRGLRRRGARVVRRPRRTRRCAGRTCRAGSCR